MSEEKLTGSTPQYDKLDPAIQKFLYYTASNEFGGDIRKCMYLASKSYQHKYALTEEEKNKFMEGYTEDTYGVEPHKTLVDNMEAFLEIEHLIKITAENLSIDEILKEQIYSDPKDFQPGRPIEQIPARARRCIEQIEYDEVGNIKKLKLYSKQKAIELYLKKQGMLDDSDNGAMTLRLKDLQELFEKVNKPNKEEEKQDIEDNKVQETNNIEPEQEENLTEAQKDNTDTTEKSSVEFRKETTKIEIPESE